MEYKSARGLGMISSKSYFKCSLTSDKRERTVRIVRMDYRLYDMSEPHSDIGVSLWGPGQALCFKPSLSTVSRSP